MKGLPNSPQGDVDILLWKPRAAEQAVAIEVKRIKANLDGQGGDRINKLHEFATGVQQANLLARIGFWKVYLWVFVMVDSRLQNDGKITYAGLGGDLQREVTSRICTEGLNERVGLIHYEFVQPMDNAPLEVGSAGGHLIRLAEGADQPAAVTAWVDRLDKAQRA